MNTTEKLRFDSTLTRLIEQNQNLTPAEAMANAIKTKREHEAKAAESLALCRLNECDNRVKRSVVEVQRLRRLENDARKTLKRDNDAMIAWQKSGDWDAYMATVNKY